MKTRQKTTPEPDVVMSVRSLLRHPDIADRTETAPGLSSFHARVQAALARRYKSFVPEVTLQADYEVRGRWVRVRGRADGLYRTRGGWKLVEIKTGPLTPAEDLRLLEVQAQLRYYAALAEQPSSERKRRKIVSGEIILRGPRGGLLRVPISLANAAQVLLDRLAVELDIQDDRRTHSRNLETQWSAIGRHMRAGFRHEQSEMVDALADALPHEHAVCLTSPPGTGKTRAVLWAALNHAIPLGIPIVYFTAKTTGAHEALATLKEMQDAGLPVRLVWLVGRDQLCPNCPDYPDCLTLPLTRKALAEGELSALLIREHRWNPETLASYAREKGLCNYELNREAVRFADVVVADDYFLFEGLPPTRRRPFALLDEVHQLAERLRQHVDLFLSMEKIRSTKHLSRDSVRPVRRMLQLIRPDRFASWEDFSGYGDEWNLIARELRSQIELEREWGKQNVLAKMERMAHWLAVSPQTIRLVPVVLPSGVSGFQLSLTDHGTVIRERLKRFSSVVGFSGTLPLEDRRARQLIGFPSGAPVVRIQAPCKPAVRIMIIPEGSSRYPLRLVDLRKYITVLAEVMRLRPGIYLVFGQSHAHVHELSDMLTSRGHFCLELSKGISDEELRQLLGKAEMVGFVLAPLGGQFSEAINLPVDLLTGLVILGLGIPPPTASSEIRRHFLESEDEEGFEEVYIVPAMTRVVQAAGRLTRGPGARGIVLLVDERFAQERYLSHLPPEWYERSPKELICTHWKREIRNA
jgi:DNA excision repair protein ERCC-2